MKTALRAFILFLSITYILGCVFEEDTKVTNEVREKRRASFFNNMLKKAGPGIKNTDIWKNKNNVAGPFEVQDHSSKEDSDEYEDEDDDKARDSKPSWNHNDQEDWSKNYPMCSGKEQSPILIQSAKTEAGDAPCFVWKNYNNKHPNMNIINNGHSVDVIGPWGEGEIEVLPTMSGGPLKGEYVLENIHWHWGDKGKPGFEHSIDYSAAALEMHFVHRNIKYSNATAALASGEPEAIAVVGLSFQAAKKNINPLAKTMLRTLEKANKGEPIYPPLFPLSIIKQETSYYTYMGSLTTPPCNEGLRWIVLEKMINIPQYYINVFKKFLVDGKPMINNFRAAQLINGRKIVKISSSTC